VKIAAAQMELVPDIEANAGRIRDFIEQAAALRVDIMNFPETALTGYEPELFRGHYQGKDRGNRGGTAPVRPGQGSIGDYWHPPTLKKEGFTTA
jgi:predicted amidohydrolase